MRIGVSALRDAARSGRSALTEEAERAIDALLAGPLPESVGRSVIKHKVLQRVVAEALDVHDGEDPLELAVERVTATPAFRKALLEALSAPEVREALLAQTSGFGADLAVAFRARAEEADGRVGVSAPGYGGFASRGIALVLDGLLVYVAFLAAIASAALVAWLAGGSRPGWVAGAVAGGAGVLVAGGYFTAMWSTAGQSFGMRLLGLRVQTRDGDVPGVARSLLRFAGLAVSILTLGLGFLPALFDSRRRALQDFLAGTVVVR